MKHFYRIGEISKLYGIGPDSLRYYEELGLIHPQRSENQYRMYHIHDLWRLNVIRDLRNLGFSMERIQAYLDDRSLASTEAMLTEELAVIKTRMDALERLKANLEDRLSTLREVQSQPLHVICEKELPARRCYTIRSGYEQDEEMDLLIKQLLNQNPEKLYIIGSNRIGSVIPLSEAENGHFRAYSQVFLIDKDGDETIPGGLYLSVSYEGDCARNADFIPALLQYAREHKLTPAGPVLELLLADIHQTETEQERKTELQLLCSTC